MMAFDQDKMLLSEVRFSSESANVRFSQRGK
jgi:hypothetical protein